MGWRTKPFPSGKNKLVQQAIGPTAGPIVGCRIDPLPYLGEQACPAVQWSNWENKLVQQAVGLAAGPIMCWRN